MKKLISVALVITMFIVSLNMDFVMASETGGITEVVSGEITEETTLEASPGTTVTVADADIVDADVADDGETQSEAVAAASVMMSTFSVNTVDEASHSHDDSDDVEWISLADAVSNFTVSDNNYIMTSGYYYLEGDYELAMGLLINTGVTVTLCLNDHLLSIVENNPTAVSDNEITDSIIIVYGGTFNLTDCGTTARYWDTENSSIEDGTDEGGSNEFTGGAITGGSNSRNVLGGGAICVSSGAFNMYSGNIVGNKTEVDGILGAGVYVNDNATFTMNDGAIIGNISAGNAGGVYIKRLGTFIMNGGTISYNGTANNTNYGGGVYAVGTFTMNDGLIDSNFNLGGGAVSVVYAGWGNIGGVFTMNGGSITNNYASGNCGAIFIGSGGSFIMNGGEISGNSTSGFGGAIGVRYADSTATIYNGIIEDNTALGGAGGIHVNAGTLNIGQADSGDTITIYNNTVGGEQCNVYLPTGITITQIGSLDTNCSIGVTKANGTGTAAVSSTNPAYSITESDTKQYSSDEEYYRILDVDAVILLNEGTIPGIDTEIEYSADAYDVSALFDLTARHGDISYTLATTGTGTGALDADGNLTVTKIGTFDVEISTTYTLTAEPKTGSATLTVTPKGITITDLLAESRAIIEDDYSVMLVDISGTITDTVDGDEVSIDFSSYVANITDEDYEDAVYTDGEANFGVAVTDLTLTGDDAGNYHIISIEDTTVTIKTEVLNITWPTASDIYTIQTQENDSELSGGTVTLIDTDENEITIEGTFTWVEPSEINQEAGTYTGMVIFTPTDTQYSNLFTGVTGEVEYEVNELPAPTVIEGEDKTQVYQADAIDVTSLDMFDLTDSDLGTPTYTITPLTGEGTIDGTTIDVTKVGTFTVTVTTTGSTDDNISGSIGTATLTITPIEVTISDLVAEERGPIENYYNVTLDGVTGTITGSIVGDEVSIDFSSYTARITDETYDSVTNTAYTDGEGKFPVTVTGLTLTGEDAENYTIKTIEPTEVTIKMSIPYIAWPTATNITYGQNQDEDTTLIGGKVIIKDTDSGEYIDITDTGTFEWVDPTSSIQDAGTHTGTVKFVEADTGATGTYHDILGTTTREVEYLIEAAPVEFSVTNNSVEYGGYVNPTVVVMSSGTATTPVEGNDYTVLYTRLVDGVYEYVTYPVEVGTYFVSVEFTNISEDDVPNYNYYHTGTIVSTGKQIGVLVIYEEDEEPQGYDVTFTDFEAYNITAALPQTIHILPSLDTDTYLGWETELGVFYDFGSRFPQPEYDVVFHAVLAADNHTISGTVTGTDLDSTTDTELSNIAVVLMSGNTQVATTETDENGYYSFSVMPGRYTIEFTRDQYGVKYIESVYADATEGDVVVDLVFPDGRYNIELNLAAGMDDITVDGLQDILNELSNDKTVENSVEFNINQVDVTSAEYLDILAAAAENNLTTDNIKLFYDIQITEEITEGTVTEVDEVDTLFTCYIPLSGIYQAKESYAVYRNDGSGIGILTTTQNNDGEYIKLTDDGKTLMIVAKKSAIYAISFLEPAPTIITGKDVTKTYQSDAIDILDLGMFDLTGLGAATYTITPVTGEGVIDGTTLDVTKVGTFTVTVTTAATSTASAMQGTATLTIEPKTIAVSDLETISRGPVEDDYYVALDDTVEGTIIGVINDDDVSLSYDNSYGKIQVADYTEYTYYEDDGNATFAVSVGGLELTGEDKDNYILDDMADTTVDINIDIPYIAWPTAPDINYHEDLTSSTLYGGKVIVLDTATKEYVEIEGTFEWVNKENDIDENDISKSDIGTYSQDVEFVEDKLASNTPEDTSYRTLLEVTTHEVEFIIKATSVEFKITDNDVPYTGEAQYATVTDVAESGKALTDDEYTINYFQFVDGSIVYVDAPTEVGTYLISGEFSTANYHHAGTLEYTAKQIGVFNIYDTEPTETFTVTFEGYEALTITEAYDGDIHILPSITDADGTVSTAYTGWSYNGSTYDFGSRFPQPASDVTLTPVEAPETYSLSGTVYGEDLDGSKDVALNKIAVAIMQGSEMIANGETDGSGEFSFDLPAGYYMVVVTRDQIVYNEVTVYVEITDQAVVLDKIVLPDTAQNIIVEIASGVSVSSVDGLDKMLEYYISEDASLLNAISNTIYVDITSIDIEGANQPEYDEIMAEAAKEDITTDTLKLFFDVSISRDYDGNSTQIHTIPNGGYVEFYISLPGTYQGDYEYQVYRYHTDEDGNSRVDVITTTENEYGEKITLMDDGQTLKVKAKYYSVYGVAYTEVESDTSTETTVPDSGDTDPGSTDSGNTDPGSTDSGNTDSGNTDSGSTDSGSTDSGSTTSTSSSAAAVPTNTVTYELNGGKGSLPEVACWEQGATVTVKTNTVIQDGYIFTGWLSSEDGEIYAAGDTFIMPGHAVVLTAQWSLAYNPVNVPQTGDFSNNLLLIILAGVFVTGMVLTRKKRDKSEGTV